MPSGAGGSSSRLMPDLPAGFRFHPTDEELIVHYLTNQAAALPCPVPIIAEVNIYQCNPWDLPAKALFGENEWYFFSPRDRKYPNGARPNRAAGSGYWKATGTDKAILSASEHVGVKKALVFYSGRPPKGVKTDWIMHEYRLTATASAGKSNTTKRSRGSFSMRLDDWVLCRIHKKSNDFFQLSDQEQEGSSTVEDDSSLANNAGTVLTPSPKSEAPDHDHLLLRQAPQATTTAMAAAPMSKSCSLTDLLNTIDCAALSQMLLLDAPPAADEPPLIYHPTTAAHTTHEQTFNYRENNNSLLVNGSSSHFISNSLPPRVDSSGSDNNGLKRNKRTMMAMDAGAAAGSFDDGGSSSDFSKKLKLQPRDSRIINHGHHHLVGSSSGTGSYCTNQLLLDTHNASGFQFHQPSSLMMMSYPFLQMQ